MRRIRVTFRGWWAVAATMVLFGAPRALDTPPTAADVVEQVRLAESRRVAARYLDPLRTGPGPERSRLGSALASELRAIESRPMLDVRVKRTWVGPPIARRFAYVVRVSGSPQPEYYRLSRGMASPVSRAWWVLPLF